MNKTELMLTDGELDRIADKVVEKLQNANIEKSKVKTGICPTCGKTAKRKYLNELGITQLSASGKVDDERWEQWNKEIEECGFPSYETWCLDYYFYVWLYERLKMFVEVASKVIDLECHKFKFEDAEYTQLELINKMIEGCKLCILEEERKKNLTNEESKLVKDVPTIWAIVWPYMWW